MFNLEKHILDYGVLGIFVLVLLYAIKKLAESANERITEDRKVFEKINDSLTHQNEIYELLINELKTTQNFFENTINHERKKLDFCYETIYKTQLEKKEKLIAIETSLKSFHKRLSEIEHGQK